MQLLLNINQSISAIRDNLFRAGITIFIVAIGITSLVGVLTAIDGVKYWMGNSFSSMGTNTFRLVNRSGSVRMGGGPDESVRYTEITYTQAMEFKERFRDYASVSVTAGGSFATQVKYRQETTNPNLQLIGTDEDYLKTARYTIAEGRNLTREDINLGRNVTVLGYAVKQKLFPKESPIDKMVSINGKSYLVVGLFEEMGSTGSMGGDKILIIPVSSLRQDFPSTGRSFTLNIFVDDPEEMNYVMEEAKGTFRLVRRLRPNEANNFEVVRSDAFVDELMSNLRVLTLSATLIALITLLGASVALLNVMLVSVTERTNEIGIRKALGATQRNILMQFLLEAIMICQIGGLLGILLGLLVGNIVSAFLSAGFVIPWLWIGIGLVACFVVGVASGIYPAWKAARVDPIDSLRHE
jgi:putative ABC transport system permease protein